MSEHSYTHHLIVLHPDEASVLLLEAEDSWQLPKFSPKEGFFPLTEEINRFMKTTFDLDGVVLRPVHYWESGAETHFDTLYLCEAQTLSQNVSGQWFRADQLETVSFEQPDHKPFALTALAEDAGLKAIPERRPTWARRGWWKEVEVWLQEELARLGYVEVGSFEQLKGWSISTVGRIQTDRGTLYFKAAPPLFACEAEITSTLAQLFPLHLPQIITTHPDRGWFVMADFGDHHLGDGAALMAALRRLAELQIEALNYKATLLASGCEDRPLAALGEAFDRLLERSKTRTELKSEDLEILRESRPKILSMLSELVACDVPETLVHGDFHSGNVVVRGEDCVIFDWTDACITHPYLDIAHAVSYYEEPERQGLIATYLEPWRRTFPEAQHERAFALAEILVPIFFAQTYERILGSFEPSSRWEFEGAVENYLTKLVAKLKEGSMVGAEV